MNILLSTTDAESFYYPLFLENPNQIFKQLETELPFHQESIRLYGKTILEPRTKCLLGDDGVKVRYSGSEMKALPWTPTLAKVRAAVEEATASTFNCCLANRYEDGKQYMGYHRDNELQNDRSTPIASISLGAERDFLMRRYRRKDEKVSIKLENGSLLVMMPNSFESFEHSLPKRLRITSPRINLTFRRVQG